MKDNAVIDPSRLVDWAAAQLVASRLGPRTQGLVAGRDIAELVDWLPWAAETSRVRAPAVADMYDELASLVGFALPPAQGGVDRHGDVLGGAG
jgi:hypothetical protein